MLGEVGNDGICLQRIGLIAIDGLYGVNFYRSRLAHDLRRMTRGNVETALVKGGVRKIDQFSIARPVVDFQRACMERLRQLQKITGCAHLCPPISTSALGSSVESGLGVVARVALLACLVVVVAIEPAEKKASRW